MSDHASTRVLAEVVLSVPMPIREFTAWSISSVSSARSSSKGLTMRESQARGPTGRPLMWGESPVDSDSAEQATFHLPVGTVTFMLTDVDGSTRVQESAPEAMAAAVIRHDALLEEVTSRHGGVRSFREAFIRWVGDGSMLLFGVAGT
jgi:class 3 adenylate cyclase